MHVKWFVFFSFPLSKVSCQGSVFLVAPCGVCSAFHASAREFCIFFIERGKSHGAEAEGNDTDWWLSSSLYLYPSWSLIKLSTTCPSWGQCNLYEWHINSGVCLRTFLLSPAHPAAVHLTGVKCKEFLCARSVLLSSWCTKTLGASLTMHSSPKTRAKSRQSFPLHSSSSGAPA